MQTRRTVASSARFRVGRVKGVGQMVTISLLYNGDAKNKALLRVCKRKLVPAQHQARSSRKI